MTLPDMIPEETYVGFFRWLKRKIFGDERKKNVLTKEQLAAYERDRNRRLNS